MIIILATKFENCWPREFLIWLHAFNEYFLDHEMISKGTINSGKDGGFQVKEELWQCVKGFCCYSVAKLWPTLCNFKAVAHQALLSSTVSQSLLKLMSIESVMPANHLILCRRLSSCPQSCPVSSPVNRSSHQVAKVLRIQDWLIYTSKALRDVVYSLEERLI